MNIQDKINRIRSQSQVKFKIVEEYIEIRQQASSQDARNRILKHYMPQAETVLEILMSKTEVPVLRDRITQNLNNFCNEAEALFAELAQMR